MLMRNDDHLPSSIKYKKNVWSFSRHFVVQLAMYTCIVDVEYLINIGLVSKQCNFQSNKTTLYFSASIKFGTAQWTNIGKPRATMLRRSRVAQIERYIANAVEAGK